MGYRSSGNASVDKMGTMSIKGNVVSVEWYRKILRDNGKPHMLAISILADIVYWYRPNEVRDQHTGYIIGWQKRFAGDMLQKTYEEYADLYGESKRSIKAAFDVLVNIGVIRRVFRDLKTRTGLRLNNVMYVDLDTDILEELSHSPEAGNTDDVILQDDDGEDFSEIVGERCSDGEPLRNDVGGGTKFCRRGDEVLQEDTQSFAAPHTKFCGTNTENTTEITNREHSNHILSVDKPIKLYAAPELAKQMGLDRSDEMDENARRYRELIWNNTDYAWHVHSREYKSGELYKDLVDLMCDVVCARHTGPIRINRADYPSEVVKSRLLKLNSEHLEYVVDKLEDNPNFKGIDNERAYMLTCLFNAPVTCQTHYQQRANHDMLCVDWTQCASS